MMRREQERVSPDMGMDVFAQPVSVLSAEIFGPDFIMCQLEITDRAPANLITVRGRSAQVPEAHGPNARENLTA